ncbi:hypothetical protein [Helicobacter fennelliae]|uniref:hypothetical protein n=1 Tax=Helicobacter fennelliae TaxID=215 RepID=UPI000DFA095D|nr:hypothetical protein [Helicobacter fennelliae]STQ84527.1 Protein hydE [Helicobacter fennelliae]
MFGFVFKTSKPKTYSKDFVAILESLAVRYALCFAHRFDTITTPFSFYFVIKGESQQVLDFANAVSETLPLSIYFVFEKIEPLTPLTAEKDLTQKDTTNESATNGRATPKNAKQKITQNLDSIKRFYKTQKSISHIPNVQETKHILHIFEEQDSKDLEIFEAYQKRFFTQIFERNMSDLYQGFIRAIEALRDQKSIAFHTQRGVIELSLTQSDCVLFFELGALQTFMRVDSVQMGILASFEKPSMRLCAKDVFRAELIAPHKVDVECMIAFDLMLALFGVVVRKFNIEYVFCLDSATSTKTSKQSNTENMEHIRYKLAYKIPPKQLLVCNKEGIFLEDKKTMKDLFALIKHHYVPDYTLNHTPKLDSSPKLHSDKELIFYLSTAHDTAIWTYDGRAFHQLLEIEFSLNPNTLLQELESYTNGDVLIHNYKQHFGRDCLEFGIQSSPNSKNLIEIFGVIAKILGLCDKNASIAQGVNSVLNYAKLFVRDKGPRIDYKMLKNSEGVLRLDCPRILRSCMSFALAGVDYPTLCYGILDSLGEFLGNFARDMQQNYSIYQVFLCGDMLAHKVFLDKITHYLPKNILLTLPQDGWIDTEK